jgi:hypothetical protein
VEAKSKLRTFQQNCNKDETLCNKQMCITKQKTLGRKTEVHNKTQNPRKQPDANNKTQQNPRKQTDAHNKTQQNPRKQSDAHNKTQQNPRKQSDAHNKTQQNPRKQTDA